MEENKEPEPVSIELRIGDVKSYKNLLTADLSNDFFLMPFMNIVLKVADEKGVLSNKGLMLLHQDIGEIMGKVKEGAGDKDRVRACLYFTISLNLSILFISFVRGCEDQYAELLDDDIKVFIKECADRIEILQSTFKSVLNIELPKLKDKYAKVFDDEKRESFTKDIFEKTPVYLGSSDETDDVSGAIEVPSN